MLICQCHIYNKSINQYINDPLSTSQQTHEPLSITQYVKATFINKSINQYVNDPLSISQQTHKPLSTNQQPNDPLFDKLMIFCQQINDHHNKSPF
jgi:hypothetical protein